MKTYHTECSVLENIKVNSRIIKSHFIKLYQQNEVSLLRLLMYLLFHR